MKSLVDFDQRLARGATAEYARCMLCDARIKKCSGKKNLIRHMNRVHGRKPHKGPGRPRHGMGPIHVVIKKKKKVSRDDTFLRSPGRSRGPASFFYGLRWKKSSSSLDGDCYGTWSFLVKRKVAERPPPPEQYELVDAAIKADAILAAYVPPI